MSRPQAKSFRCMGCDKIISQTYFHTRCRCKPSTERKVCPYRNFPITIHQNRFTEQRRTYRNGKIVSLIESSFSSRNCIPAQFIIEANHQTSLRVEAQAIVITRDTRCKKLRLDKQIDARRYIEPSLYSCSDAINKFILLLAISDSGIHSA